MVLLGQRWTIALIAALCLSLLVAAAPPMPAAAEDQAPQRDTAAHTPTHRDRLAAYRGLATWIDIYDEHTWDRPVRSVRKMHREGVQTLFLETANWRIDRAVFRPDAAAKMIEAAHRRGIRVVAWYLPSFKHPRRDYRRSLAAIRFRTPNGHRFDGFALDIESTEVRDLTLRNKRMRRLSKRIRSAVGPRYTLGAIVPEAGALYWPNFPYKTVARHYDVFLPMAYFTFRTSGARGVDRFIRRNIRAVRRETGDPTTPVHIIGGLSGKATMAEVRAFVAAARALKVTGASLYEFETTTKRQWRRLRRLRI